MKLPDGLVCLPRITRQRLLNPHISSATGHTRISTALKQENNNAYLTEGCRLCNVDCGECSKRLVKTVKKEETDMKVKLDGKCPTYYCDNPNCHYIHSMRHMLHRMGDWVRGK
jgi:hypothetical protein